MDNLKVTEKAGAHVFQDMQNGFSHDHVATELAILSSLRSRYPDWTVTLTPAETGIIAFADAGQAKAEFDNASETFLARRMHVASSDRLSGKPGVMDDKVVFGRYYYQWQDEHYIVYKARFGTTGGFQNIKIECILHKRDHELVDGHCMATEDLITAAQRWSNDVHNEVLVFDQEMWTKNKELWKSVEHASWADVILDKELKQTLIQDVEGFFDSRADYKEFAVPWKRGIIFHGTPGNGKTISIKALMNALSSRPEPIPTLYVKSLAGCHGPEYSVREIFVKARQSVPCLLIFEDLDSLITNKVKSFFLNEIDGLESNEGLMMIGSTNHLERLDAGISKRPSRFDRKYHFALPATPERVQYCQYWKAKLAKNKTVDYPDKLSAAIADITEGFSFAYLKEAFITSLLIIVGAHRGTGKEIDGVPEMNGETNELDHILLWRVIKKQVQTLRDEMESARKSAEDAEKNNTAKNGTEEESDVKPCGPNCC